MRVLRAGAGEVFGLVFSPDARARAMSLGASAFATKPYRPEALFELLSAQRGGDARRSSVRPP